MHESHQVQRLIAETQEALKKRGAARAREVSILVGELLGFDEMSIRLHWEEMTLGTALEGATLAICFVPAKLQCPKCAKVFDKKGSEMSCPVCRVIGTPTPSGREFSVKDIAV
jgi:hydrogenase nickel insertion protein HypA